MTMKRTELEKRAGLQVRNALQQRAQDARFGAGAAAPADRRAQRERDRALGLVPFAVKLPNDLVRRLQETAQARGLGLNELTAELLNAALSGAKTD